MTLFRWKKPRRGRPRECPRALLQVRTLTREFIRIANASERLGANCEATSPQDMAAVRALRAARHALLKSMQRALADGLDRAAIQADGIDYAAATTIVMSELAHHVVDEVRSLA